jgi:arginase
MIKSTAMLLRNVRRSGGPYGVHSVASALAVRTFSSSTAPTSPSKQQSPSLPTHRSSFPVVDTVSSEDLKFATVGIFGVAEDGNSSYRRGPAQAPPWIRSYFHCSAGNLTSETGVDMYDGNNRSTILDFGDVKPSSPSHTDIFDAVQPVMQKICEKGLIPVALGGDHSISFPLTRALRKFVGAPFTIIHFDAHPDIYPDFEGNPSSHASPFARICETGSGDGAICSKLISIGIRTGTTPQLEQYKKYDVTCVEARHLSNPSLDISALFHKFIPSEESLVYISFDMDCLDPSCAPGVSHREPGGLSTRQAFDIIHSIPGQTQ